jgi:hypothetical protein
MAGYNAPETTIDEATCRESVHRALRSWGERDAESAISGRENAHTQRLYFHTEDKMQRVDTSTAGKRNCICHRYEEGTPGYFTQGIRPAA